jgi:hypothetical protein
LSVVQFLLAATPHDQIDFVPKILREFATVCELRYPIKRSAMATCAGPRDSVQRGAERDEIALKIRKPKRDVGFKSLGYQGE